MFRLSSPGRLFYAIAITLIGIQFIIYSDFNSSLFPLSFSFMGRNLIMRSFGIITFLCGFAMGLEKYIAQASIVLATLLTVVLLFVHVPGIFAHPRDGWALMAAFEILALISGALMFPANYSLNKLNRTPAKSWMKVAKWGLILFACSLAVVGIQYFVYDEDFASIVPAMIPLENIVRYTVGLIFLAFALIFFTGRRLLLGAGVLSLLYLVLIFIVHTPRIVENPQNHDDWTNGFVALAISGIGMIIGGNIPRREVDKIRNFLDVDERHLNAS
jgi:uncharacterized membrane protein